MEARGRQGILGGIVIWRVRKGRAAEEGWIWFRG